MDKRGLLERRVYKHESGGELCCKIFAVSGEQA